MGSNLLDKILSGPLGPVPLYLRRFEIDVGYVPSYDPDGDRETIEDAVREVESALKRGFFAWSYFPQRHMANLTLDWTQGGGFILRGEAEGLHHNLLVALVRLVATLHHTPLASYESARIALGDDAGALLPRRILSETLASVRITGLTGAPDGRMSDRSWFDAYMRDDDITLPATDLFLDVSEYCEEDRIVVRSEQTGSLYDELDDIEDLFLRLCDSGCFRDPSRIDEAPLEAELFVRSPEGKPRELVIDGYEGQYYGLLELLNSLSGGRVFDLSVSRGD